MNICFSPAGSRPDTPKSDTAFECADRKESVAAECDADEAVNRWQWGELPQSSHQELETTTTAQQTSQGQSESHGQ